MVLAADLAARAAALGAGAGERVAKCRLVLSR
jgi:hypothetical protein